MPRCSLECSDAGNIRLDKLVRLIRECPHGIHDISRTELNAEGLPRFNMPFELGLFLGAKFFCQSSKRCLILDRERYRFQKFISDIGGQDPKSHENNSALLIEAVRNWLAEDIHPIRIPGGRKIHQRFMDFKQAYPSLCQEMQLDHTRFHFNDYCQLVALWASQVPPAQSAKARDGEWRTVNVVENGKIVKRQILMREPN
jgi:hypothetical protein